MNILEFNGGLLIFITLATWQKAMSWVWSKTNGTLAFLFSISSANSLHSFLRVKVRLCISLDLGCICEVGWTFICDKSTMKRGVVKLIATDILLDVFSHAEQRWRGILIIDNRKNQVLKCGLKQQIQTWRFISYTSPYLSPAERRGCRSLLFYFFHPKEILEPAW